MANRQLISMFEQFNNDKEVYAYDCMIFYVSLPN